MRFLYACAILWVVLEAVPVPDVLIQEWETYKLEYNKTYSTEIEDSLRRKIFAKKKLRIAKHNALYNEGLMTFKLGLNSFSDKFQHEILVRNGFKQSISKNNSTFPEETSSYFVFPANVALPPSVDWRKSGAVTEIKDQGECASCWAFSATGSLEGQHFRKTGTLVSLSEQNLIDCSKEFGVYGCSGGLMEDAFEYVKANHGIDTEESYPYHAINETCRYKPSSSGSDCTGYVDLPNGDELKLQAAVATIGPVSVGIDSSYDSFHSYETGIYFEPNCSTENLCHAVLVVGYDTSSDGKDFWIVKNSWGTSWGEEGYIRMSRNRGNNCGIASQASYPLV